MKKELFGFEKLDVWQYAKQLTVSVYKITNDFPDNEKFGLINQLRRAAVSVSSNIAEGSARVSRKDQAHFFHLAYSSLMEVLSQIIISSELKYIEKSIENEFRGEIIKLSKKINSLRNAVLKQEDFKNR